MCEADKIIDGKLVCAMEEISASDGSENPFKRVSILKEVPTMTSANTSDAFINPACEGLHVFPYQIEEKDRRISELEAKIKEQDNEITNLLAANMEQGVKIVELEEKLTRCQIDQSRGLYTPFHEAERKRLLARQLEQAKEFQALAEAEGSKWAKQRDAYRAVAIAQTGDVHLMRDCGENCGKEELSKEVDAEAQRILKELI